jgi:hypothetical protein
LQFIIEALFQDKPIVLRYVKKMEIEESSTNIGHLSFPPSQNEEEVENNRESTVSDMSDISDKLDRRRITMEDSL